MKKINLFLVCLFLLMQFSLVLADSPSSSPSSSSETLGKYNNAVEKRADGEQKHEENPFVVSLYRPNYLLPFYYTTPPYDAIYTNHTPDTQKVKNTEAKFQISFKVPVWKYIFGTKSILYAAYTQKSYWQLYTSSPYFRETDYEPELFFANELAIPLFSGWRLEFLNGGFAHQSNGRGGQLERSWDRFYLEALFANKNWLVSFKPWYVVRDASLKHNPNITHYLGHGRLLLAYKYYKQTFSVESYNNVESGFKRGAVQLGWSFPITKYIKGYAQVFTGYGQSLAEYNHYTKSVGIGLALNDWI